MMHRALILVGLLFLKSLSGLSAEPTKIRMVIVTMFEIGEDKGDTAGEFQTWVEKVPLPEKLNFPAGGGRLRLNRELGVLGFVTDVGTANAAASVMALGLDPRFDLSHAYWLVAGIAGIDPEDGSVGSAVWTNWVIDGDLSHQIDLRELGPNWPDEQMPLMRYETAPQPIFQRAETQRFHLNEGLTDWAFALTKDIDLMDTANMQALRDRYEGYPGAQTPPKVMRGDQLASMRYWHGKRLNEWANRWVHYWSEGQGEFVTSAMEDSGTLQSLAHLGRAGRVDMDRVMILRTASNYSFQDDGTTAIDSLAGTGFPDGAKQDGFKASLDAAWRVGSRVMHAITGNWQQYRHTPPQAQD